MRTREQKKFVNMLLRFLALAGYSDEVLAEKGEGMTLGLGGGIVTPGALVAIDNLIKTDGKGLHPKQIDLLAEMLVAAGLNSQKIKADGQFGKEIKEGLRQLAALAPKADAKSKHEDEQGS